MGWFWFGDDEDKPEGKEEKEDLGDKVNTIKKAAKSRRDRLADIMGQMPGARKPKPKKKPTKRDTK